MVDYNTKQFVEFNRVNELNEWLRLYSNRIIIDDWKILRLREVGVNYIVQFHLEPKSAKKLFNGNNKSIPYSYQFQEIISKAYQIQ